MIVAPPASAYVLEGNCTGTANAQSFAANSSSNPLEVKQHTYVSLSGLAPDATPGDPVRISLEYFGIDFATRRTEINSQKGWAGAVPIDRYATYGVGSYRANVFVGELPAMEQPFECFVSVFVKVKGNPLATAGGLVAAGVTLAGGAGLAASGVRGARGPRLPEGFEAGVLMDSAKAAELEALSDVAPAREEAVIKDREMRDRKALELVDLLGKRICAAMMFPAIFMVMGAPMGGGAPSRPRAHWRPRISFIGLVGGLLFGAGGVVLLAQYSIIFPTRNAGITALIAGLALGLVVPSLGRLRAVRKTNRRIDALYRGRSTSA